MITHVEVRRCGLAEFVTSIVLHYYHMFAVHLLSVGGKYPHMLIDISEKFQDGKHVASQFLKVKAKL